MKMLEKTLIAVALGAGIVASTAFAASHGDKATADAVKARHAQMQMVGYHIGILGGVAKGEIDYDSAVVDAAANNLATLASLSHATLWVEGSEQGAVEGSRAKAEIWTDRAGFETKFNDMKTAASALVGAADAAAVGAGMGALGGACKACHENYRGPKN